jgi:hypothetical protein
MYGYQCVARKGDPCGRVSRYAGQYDPAQMKLFDGVLMRMIERIEIHALAELGERLAPIDGAPVEVIRHLARHDEIIVAGPVLKDSK